MNSVCKPGLCGHKCSPKLSTEVMTLKLVFHSSGVYHMVNTDATMNKTSFLLYLQIYATKKFPVQHCIRRSVLPE